LFQLESVLPFVVLDSSNNNSICNNKDNKFKVTMK